MPPKGKGRTKAADGHQHASALQKGVEMKDLRKNSWFLGEPVGTGGFGLLYLADRKKDCIGKDKAEFVIKVEPRENGPLFCELAFYQRAAKPEFLAAWQNSSGLSYVGIPPYIAHGLHVNGGENLRFMVMPRYGCDLHSLWLKANKRFSRTTVCQLAIELINSLEYMHVSEYVHADVKGTNVLLGHEDPNQIFLVDFGLAYRYVVNGKHKDYQEDPRKAHDGTIEYTSRDAHLGVSPSRRSDLEILGYVLLHWLSGKLPWEDNLKDKNYVKGQKIKHMKNVKQFVTSVYPDPHAQANEIEKFLQDVSKLEYNEQPNYDLLRKYFQDALESMRVPLKSEINFEIPETSTQIKKLKRSAPPKEKPHTSGNNSQSLESDDEEVTPKKRARKSPAKRNQMSNSPKEDLFSMKSTTTSEEAPPRTSANDSQSLQSNEKEVLPEKRARKSPAKRKQVSSSPKEDLSSMKSTTSEEARPYTSANDSQSLQSNEKEVLPKKRARKSPANRKQVSSSPKEDLSSMKSTTTSEEAPSLQSNEKKVLPKKQPRKSPANRKQVSSSPKEDLSSMKSTTTSEEAPRLQSNVKEVLPNKQARKSPAKRKQVSSSPKEDLSSMNSNTASEEAPTLHSNEKVENLPKKRALKSLAKRKQLSNSPKEDLSSTKSTTSSEDAPVKTSYARKKAISSVKKTAPKRERKQKRLAPPETSSDEAEREKPARSKKAVRTEKSKPLTENGPSTSAITDDDEINVIDSTFSSTSPVRKKDTRSSSAKQKTVLKKNNPKENVVSTPSIAKSRYSMAPLHTKSILGKDDSLSGKYLGKHPVIIRRRKVKRPRTDAVTQTTPSLRKRTTRVQSKVLQSKADYKS